MRNILCPEDWIVNSCRLNEWLVRFSPEDCQLELRHDGGGGDPGCGLRGRRVAQTLLRLRRGEHLDDDLHRTLLWVQSQDQHVLLQVSHNLRANYFISNLRCKVNRFQQTLPDLRLLSIVGGRVVLTLTSGWWTSISVTPTPAPSTSSAGRTSARRRRPR